AIGVTGSRTDHDRVMEIAWTSRYRDPKIQANDLIGWNSHDVRDQLHLIPCPVLLVRGEEDFMVPRELMVDTQAGIPGAEFIELPGIGHFPHVEHPDLAGIIVDFLERRGLGIAEQ